MIAVISPSKTQDFTQITCPAYTQPQQLTKSQQLINILKQKSVSQLKELMTISQNLAHTNQQRYQDFHTPFNLTNAKPAIFAFRGDVYSGIDVANYHDDELAFMQRHLRILSGLYGVLRPLDLIQAYRLEMGTKLTNKHGKNLYEFWGGCLSEQLNQDKPDTIVNLASNEYFKGIKQKALHAKILQIDFKENRNNHYKIIGIYAKKARGLMVNYMIKNHINQTSQLKRFNDAGYQFNPEFSTDWHWVFSRG